MYSFHALELCNLDIDSVCIAFRMRGENVLKKRKDFQSHF